MDDGRYNNNGWLQEMPDPITKMVWDNAVLISRKTAQRARTSKTATSSKSSSDGRTVRGPIWVQPGMADYSLGLALGYGRDEERSRRARDRFQCLSVAHAATRNILRSARQFTKTGKTYLLACTQDHWSMEGRPIIREANLEAVSRNIRISPKRMNMEEPPGGAASALSQPVR